MCGINLALDLNGNLSSEIMNRMLKATSHRGPHQSRTEILGIDDRQVFLGANRLRISDDNDLSDQPFTTTNGRHYLLYNGEIYNHYELKNELIRKGISFRTHSDTEILCHFLKYNGSNDIGKLNGMFAFLFIDLGKNEIRIARDRWGMKPLYYYHHDNLLLISSEIRGIIATGMVKKEFNKSQIPHYLRYRYPHQQQTFYKNIFPFLKGRDYTFHIDKNEWSVDSYENDTTDYFTTITKKEIIEKTEELLIDSLITHTTGRWPAGIFISGGIDSTLLLALARKHQIPLPYLFSIVSKGSPEAFSTKDNKYSRKAVDIYAGQAVTLEYDDTILEEMKGFIQDLDQPVADGASLLTCLLSREALKHTHVVLSGAGADELFAGYNRHHAFNWYLKNYTKISNWKEPIARILNLIPLGRNIPVRKKLLLIRKFINRIEESPYRTFDNFMSLNSFPSISDNEEWESISEDNFYEDNLLRALERDRNEYLPEDVLAVNDRSAMSYHIEMRMPYLDSNISGFVRKIPGSVLLDSGPKWILKELLSQHQGDLFTRRTKEGFGFPFGLWIRQRKYSHLIDYIYGNDELLHPYLDKSSIRSIINKHLSGKADYSQEIWSILIVLLWYKHHFD